MGNAANKLYSKEDMLYYYIEKRSYDKASELLKQKPEILQKILTKESKHTALMRAVYVGDEKMTDLVLQFNPNINFANKRGQTALIIAVKRNRINIVRKLLVQHKAEANVQATIDNISLKPIDYAILAGFYDIAFLLLERVNGKQIEKTLKSVRQYEQLGRKYNYRYVNYEMMVNSLLRRESPQNTGNYLKKQKIVLRDPVIDPRESWKDWAKRVADFKDAPLVERDELPQQLQPQNRFAGKIHHFADSFIRTPNKQKSSIQPSQKAMSEMGDFMNRNHNQATKMDLVNPSKQECQSEIN